MGDERRDYRLAYSRGWNAGVQNRWPLYHPPKPPDETVAAMMTALEELASVVSDECAKFGDDDPFSARLSPYLARADAALEGVGRFARKPTA